jgi:hypothetical protein
VQLLKGVDLDLPQQSRGMLLSFVEHG